MFQKGRDHTFKLNDGRDLGYSIIGDIQGKPVLFFHGWPGTRLDVAYFTAEAKQLGIRLISIDRPGCGLSTYQKGREMSDLKDDILQLLDHLKIAKISVLGFSTGGVYALDLASTYPDRINIVGIVSGVPYYKLEYVKKDYTHLVTAMRIIPKIPFFGQLITRIITDIGLNKYKRKPEKEFEKSIQKLPEIDKKTWNIPKLKRWFLDEYIPDLLESSRKGITQDLMLLMKSFANPKERPSEIQDNFPVHFWHGFSDDVVPATTSIQQTKLFKDSDLVIYLGEGHKVIYTHFQEIIRKII